MRTPTGRQTTVLDDDRATTRGRLPRMSLVLFAGVVALAAAAPSWAQRYLSERVIKGIQVQGTAFKVASGFVAIRTAGNEITVRQAKDAKSVEGKLECDCSGAKKGEECGVEIVQNQVVCKGAGCEGGTCKVRPAAGWKLP